MLSMNKEKLRTLEVISEPLFSIRQERHFLQMSAKITSIKENLLLNLSYIETLQKMHLGLC